jgi:hypothetical protein
MPANFGIDGCGYSGDFPECLSPPGKLRRDCHPGSVSSPDLMICY